MSQGICLKDFIQKFEAFAPKTLALDKDPIGLHFGREDQTIHRVLVTLDVRPEVVEEAKEKQCDFIFSHHPPIFKSPRFWVEDNPQSRMYAEIVRQGMAVYAAHTNLDAARGGMNDWLAEAYGIMDPKPFGPHKYLETYRVVAYVPEDSVEDFVEGLLPYGFGRIGDYDNCQFALDGEGSYTPGDGTDPYIGRAGQRETTAERAISFPVSEVEVDRAISVCKALHPYEEPVVEAYRIQNADQPVAMGRIGQLEAGTTFQDLVDRVREVEGLSHLRTISPDPKQPLERAAVLGGSGSSYYDQALAAGADVFITADVTYHTAHDIYETGLGVIDAGHHMEAICIPKLTELFEKFKAEEGWPIDIVPSQVNTDPYRIY